MPRLHPWPCSTVRFQGNANFCLLTFRSYQRRPLFSAVHSVIYFKTSLELHQLVFKNLLTRILPSWWNCHFKTRYDNQRNKLKWGLWQGEKLHSKKEKPGSYFLPLLDTKIISLPPNKPASRFWTNKFKSSCPPPAAEWIPIVMHHRKITSYPHTTCIPHISLAAALH